MIAQGDGWRIEDVTCTAGPDSRAFEERHGGASIAAVVSGSFRYRSDAGSALLYPGAFLLGNPGACFECGHDHSRGDRCIAIHLNTALFEEVSATAASQSHFRFPAAMMPALPELLPTLVSIEALLGTPRLLAAGTFVLSLAERVTETMSGAGRRKATRLGAGEEKRISAAIQHLELNSQSDLDLDTLASISCMSKYHFLRVFRQVTGVTPYKYLLALRMRRAAVALQASSVSISTIAFDAGFGDLSTFNHRFRETFGKTPSAFRQCGAG
jgi:AraC-like DNA-binding protein